MLLFDCERDWWTVRLRVVKTQQPKASTTVSVTEIARKGAVAEKTAFYGFPRLAGAAFAERWPIQSEPALSVVERFEGQPMIDGGVSLGARTAAS
jgi:hypothetical protein